jgi:hypothetical protein
MLGETQRRHSRRFVWTLVLGLFLGGLLTKLSDLFLPESAGKEFLTTSVSAELGPIGFDLVAVGLELGPLTLNLNVLTLVGIAIVAYVVRQWI